MAPFFIAFVAPVLAAGFILVARCNGLAARVGLVRRAGDTLTGLDNRLFNIFLPCDCWALLKRRKPFSHRLLRLLATMTFYLRMLKGNDQLQWVCT